VAIKDVNSPEYLNDLVEEAIQDIKGQNILTFDLRNVDDAPTDFFIICEGESSTQVKAIAGNISRRLKSEISVRPNHTEGVSNAQWVLLDYFHTVVHVFYPETRKFYELEDLWSDAKITEYQDL